MRPLLLLILTLVSSLQAVQWPAGTKAVIPFTANKTLVGEAVPNFCYSVKIVTDARFKAAFNSAANITIFDTVTGLVRPSRIWYYTKDTVYADFDGATSTSVNKIFHACAGPAINRVNSAQAYSGITNEWGFDEQPGSTTVADYAGSVVLTNVGNALKSGFFGNELNGGNSNYYTYGSSNIMSGITAFLLSFVLNVSNLSTVQTVFASRETGTTGVGCHVQINNGNLDVYIGATNSLYRYACSTIGLTVNTYVLIDIVYNGADAVTPLKLYLNGDYKISSSIIGTIPTSLPVVSGAYINIAGRYQTTQGLLGSIDNCILGVGQIQSSGIISTRSAMLLSPQSFWTQGASFGVGKSTNNNKTYIPYKRKWHGLNSYAK